MKPSQLLTTESKCAHCGKVFRHNIFTGTVYPTRREKAKLCPKCYKAYTLLEARLARLGLVERLKFTKSPSIRGINTEYFIAHGKLRNRKPKPKPKPTTKPVSLKPSELE